MKKLVLLVAVAVSVFMTSCLGDPASVVDPGNSTSSASYGSDSTSVKVEEANPSAPSVSEEPKEEVKDDAKAAPVEEQKTEETQEEVSK